jgi:MSHA pilin protein MshC
MKGLQHHAGFTLIELIVVLIIIGVLAVSLVPRFFTSSGTSEYLYRDQALNLLRRVQMQAMQCTDCTSPQITISANTILAGAASCTDDSVLALCPVARDNIRFTATASPIQFDSMGRPVGCSGSCQLTVQGESALRVCIETEGYIHPC